MIQIRLVLNLLSLALTIILAAAPAQAGKFNEVLSAGDAAPDFSGLIGVDDAEHGLATYKDASVIVLLFTANHCPVAKAYDARLTALASDYKEKGVRVIAVSVSKLEADKLPKMKERAKAAGFNFPYLYDESQNSARAYGASATPHVFVLDGERKIAYMGRIDDDINEGRVKKRYLRIAVDAVLAGASPEAQETRPVGCPIVFE